MAINVYIVELDGQLTEEEISSQDKFDLMNDYGIYIHLSTFWKKIEFETGVSVSDIEDTFFQQENLRNLNALLLNIIKDSNEILLEEWTFYDNVKSFSAIDIKKASSVQTKFQEMAMMSDFIKNKFKDIYQYDIKEAKLGNTQMTSSQNLIRINKIHLLEYLNNFKAIIDKAVNANKRLYLSYS